ncbi:MAG: nucleoside recognition protein, partial [Rikenellaceae bacterium]|nr:nucleoside recognition protein [Rikenellaceae bacterium]
IKTICWILKLMLPITLLVACLNYVGAVDWLSVHLAPFFRFIGLSGEAVIVFLTAMLLNIYAAIAVIATLGFDFRSVTLLAVMCLIAHNLIIESAIQKKNGASAIFVTVLRIAAALLAGALLNVILPQNLEGTLMLDHITPDESPDSWGMVFAGWGKSMIQLVLQMSAFILGLNILQNILREFGIIDRLTYPLRPLMRLFGLPTSTSFLWIVANCVGLAYGGMLMVTEIEKGEIRKGDARLFNTHIAISHSLLEDTLLFAAIGVGVFWLFIPRLILAVAAVWLQRLFSRKPAPAEALQR